MSNEKKYHAVCLFCRHQFRAARPDAKYCTDKHKQAAYNRRKRAAKLNAQQPKRVIDNRPKPTTIPPGSWSAVVANMQLPRPQDNDRDW